MPKDIIEASLNSFEKPEVLYENPTIVEKDIDVNIGHEYREYTVTRKYYSYLFLEKIGIVCLLKVQSDIYDRNVSYDEQISSIIIFIFPS